MNHNKKVCNRCGSIIAQCRCMDCNKSVTFGICKKCAAKRKKISAIFKYEIRKLVKSIIEKGFCDEDIVILLYEALEKEGIEYCDGANE